MTKKPKKIRTVPFPEPMREKPKSLPGQEISRALREPPGKVEVTDYAQIAREIVDALPPLLSKPLGEAKEEFARLYAEFNGP